MADSTFFWGCARTYKIGIGVAATSWNEVSQKRKAKAENRTSAIAKKIKRNAGRIKQSNKTRGFFAVMRIMQKTDWIGWNEADSKYWNDRDWLGKSRPWK